MGNAARWRLMQGLKRVAGFGPVDWFDLVLASVELALARRLIGARTAGDLLRTTRSAPSGSLGSLSPGQLRLVSRVSFSVPRVAVRVPWRADCLVQALAAQRWLQRKGISTTLHVGVHKKFPAEFEAHAWLMQGDTIVTGGDIKRFTPLTAWSELDG